MAITASIKFEPGQMIGRLTELEKILLPTVTRNALHKSVFEASRDLSMWAGGTFDSVVPFTLKSFLYGKPVEMGDSLNAKVFIRPDAPKGNAPARYLAPQIGGGYVYKTRFQKRLEARGFIGGMQDQYMMPVLRGGNRPARSEYQKALWGIKAFEDFRMPSNKGRGYKSLGSYIWVPPNVAFQSLEHANKIRGLNKSGVGTSAPGSLPKAGIYKVLKSRLVQKFISLDDTPRVSKKFNFERIAKESVEKNFITELQRNLKRF